MSKHQDKVDLCRNRNIIVVEKRGWVRVARSKAKKSMSVKEYKEFMKEIGWESIL